MTEHPEPGWPPIVLVMDAPVVQARLEAVARELGRVLLPFRSLAMFAVPAAPHAIVVDLALDGAVDAIGGWKAAYPRTPVIGVLASPRPELWTRAEDAGADLVFTHGTVHRKLPAFLATFAARTTRRVRVASERDLEGRLGFVAAAGGSEPVAVYHVGYDLYAVSDSCPHAGATLSEGALEGTAITCPRHGSQFDVCTGARLRGPADEAIRTYPVTVEDGAIYVEIDASAEGH